MAYETDKINHGRFCGSIGISSCIDAFCAKSQGVAPFPFNKHYLAFFIRKFSYFIKDYASFVRQQREGRREKAACICPSSVFCKQDACSFGADCSGGTEPASFCQYSGKFRFAPSFSCARA